MQPNIGLHVSMIQSFPLLHTFSTVAPVGSHAPTRHCPPPVRQAVSDSVQLVPSAANTSTHPVVGSAESEAGSHTRGLQVSMCSHVPSIVGLTGWHVPLWHTDRFGHVVWCTHSTPSGIVVLTHPVSGSEVISVGSHTYEVQSSPWSMCSIAHRPESGVFTHPNAPKHRSAVHPILSSQLCGCAAGLMRHFPFPHVPSPLP